MAIQYKVIKQRNPANRDETIYFARAVSSGEVDLDELSRELEKMSTLSGADIHGTVHGLMDRIEFHLSRGKIVRLNDLLSLSVSLNSSKRYAEAEVDEASINKARLLTRPGKRIRRMLNSLKFRKKKA